MKLQRSTLALTAIALTMFGGYWIYNAQVVSRQAQIETEAKQLFDFEESDVNRLEINTGNDTLVFVKGEADQPDPSAQLSSPDTASELLTLNLPSSWQMQVPEETIASDASISFLLNLMVTGESSQTLEVEADRLPDFGFASPLATVEVILQDQTRHRIILGASDFDRTGLYAQLESPLEPGETESDAPEASSVPVRVVPINFENAAIRPLAEWKQPPPLEDSDLAEPIGLPDSEFPDPDGLDSLELDSLTEEEVLQLPEPQVPESSPLPEPQVPESSE
jgi:hypothetical protein